jgi:hypothetical protein
MPVQSQALAVVRRYSRSVGHSRINAVRDFGDVLTRDNQPRI